MKILIFLKINIYINLQKYFKMKIIILQVISILFSINIYSQIAPNTYVVKFKDKKNSEFSIEKPSEFLSERAIVKRQKYNIPVTEQDIPVNKVYTDSLKSLGLEIYAVSKWFNLAVVYTENEDIVKKMIALDFVNSSKEKKVKKKSKSKNKEYITPDIKEFKIDSIDTLDYGTATNQVRMLNVNTLHNAGFLGQGIRIAVLDAGFYHTDTLPAFDSLYANKQILGIRDFVERDNDVYKDDSHGMQVLSTIGGNIPGKLIGTAPKAEFWLLRTEESASEYIVEEYYWISGAEFADSLGLDMIHTSLGYNNFDDKVNSHKYKDMDGNSTPISIAADIASSKGILVVTSAGNEGGDPWKYVSAPADADSVLSVGAVKSDGDYAYFSSRGPSHDGRVKPEVVAQGKSTFIQGRNGDVTFASGTSFSGPIIAGAVACLWQANPEFSNMEIIEAVIKSCDQYDNPNTFTGFGIPDFAKADAYLKSLKKENPKTD